jgi:excisionase family DNA binding protein
MNSKTSLPEIFDDDSAAVYIGGITARTIRNWRSHRGLPFIRITNKVIRIRRADLDEWLAQYRVAMIQPSRRAYGSVAD